MARKASKTKPTESETEGGGQKGHGFAAGAGKITKSEAVRRALADGVDQPTDGVAYVRDNFGLEMSPTHFSSVKSTEQKKQGRITVKTRGRKPGRPAKAAAEPQPSAAVSNGDSGVLEALEAIKPLVAALGADKVKRLVDLLG